MILLVRLIRIIKAGSLGIIAVNQVASSVCRSLHRHLIFLHLLLVEQQFVCFASLGVEVLVLSQEQLVINSGFIQEHTSDSGRVFFTVGVVDGLVNVVSDEVVSVVTLELVELSYIYLRQMHLLLRLHHDLLLSWLLLRHLLLLLSRHAHGLLLLLLLVVATSHLAIVIVLVVVHLVALIVVLVAVAVWIVAFHVATSSSALTSSSTRLVSSATTRMLVSIVHVIALSLTHVLTLVHVAHAALLFFGFHSKHQLWINKRSVENLKVTHKQKNVFFIYFLNWTYLT